MAKRARTIVTVQPDGAVVIECERCDYSWAIPKAAIGRPRSDCQVGTGLLRVVFHVEHVENGVPVDHLTATGG